MAQLRISKEMHEKLRELARDQGMSMQGVLEKALDEYQRNCFFESLEASFAALKNDSEAWGEELRERRIWESTLMDGLETDEIWTEDGNVVGRS